MLPLTFDSMLLPVDGQFDAWRAALTNFDLSRSQSGPFAARALVWLLTPLILTHAIVDPLRYERSKQRLTRDRNDHLALVYLRAGRFVGDYGSGPRESVQGSLTVLDMQRACTVEAGRLEAFILSVPRGFLLARLGDPELHGQIVRGGMTPMLGAMLDGIASTLPRLDRGHASVVARTLRDMLAETLIESARAKSAVDGSNAALISRVRAYIDRHLASPLTVTAIGEAVGASRSTLYRAFAGSGGIVQQVQRRRLRALRERLSDPAERRSSDELARGLGFVDKSHAARLFKREYGITPGAFRRNANTAVDDPASVEAVPDIFRRWTKLLD